MGTPNPNANCAVSFVLSRVANYVDWQVGDRCEALYKEDNKYYPGWTCCSFFELAIIHKIDEFQIDVTVFYIGYGTSAVVDISEIRKPTTRWDVNDRLPEKDVKVGLPLRVDLGGNTVPCDLSWGWQLL